VTTKPLPCSCCPRPFAELIKRHDGTTALLIKSRHDSGGRHNNVVTLEELLQMVKEFEAQYNENTRHAVT
jgi:hypothetical protein